MLKRFNHDGRIDCALRHQISALAMVGGHVVVGLSQARENRTFQGLPLDDALKRHDAEPRCGLLVIDTATGDIVAWVRIEGVVRELYDVVFIPGIRMPANAR